ncbi:MAG: alpha/beta hydrolase, partial [Pseudomonadota bacterium]
NARASSGAAHGLDPLEVSLWMLASHDHSLTARSGMSDWLPVTKDLAKGKAWPIKIRRPFIASYIGVGWDAAAVGLFDCASSISQARRDRLSLTSQESILYTDLQSYDALCEAWDIDALPNEFRKDVSSSIPVLAFSGDFDVSTPIENAEAVMPLFENGYFVRVRRGSHNAMFEAMNERPELGNEIVSWLNGEDGPPKLIELPSPFAANDDNP